jgi:heptaprenyl diphosphate synthase
MSDDVARVELALRDAVRTPDDLLSEMASHLILAGGKRLRPLMALVGARAGGREVTAHVIQGGVAVELVHLGSLYHDDVIDEADMRRTVPSVNARWGNLRAILSGDFLLARASELAAALGAEVAGLLGATIARLCEGEIGQLRWAYNPDRPVGEYMMAIDGKTASLFAASCRIGGLVADLPRETIDALTAYGRAFGMVFQVVDDLLDVTASEAQLGKPAGHDLVEGVYNLPVIETLAAGGPAADELRDLLGHPIEGAELDKALGIIRSGPGVIAAERTARRYADEARNAARCCGKGDTVEAMAAAGHALIDSLTT